MDKVNRIHPSKPTVFAICTLLILAFFLPAGQISEAQQPVDNWVAQPMHVSQLADPYAFSGYTPSQIRTAYNLPASGGAGVTIAIIDAYHTPSVLNDLTVFSNQFGLPTPNVTTNFEVHRMSNNTGTDSRWGQETCLDVEWAHAIAPDAKILLVEAESPYDDDLIDAIDWATSQPGVVAVSMSWGAPEEAFLTTYKTHFDKPGIVFFASSGDDGAEVNWPASSARVVAVGGTTLNLYPNDTVSSETGWNGSGGGISAYVAAPAYQTSYGLNISKRVIPDVSYNADPTTGVQVFYNNQ